MKHFVSFFLLTTFFLSLFAQEIPIGTWRDHLSYNNGITVDYGDRTAFCGTSSELFIYYEDNQEIQRFSTVNGLNDINISYIKYVPSTKILIIAYENGNIDFLNTLTNTITNLPFIRNANITASKKINHIYLNGNIAYLSCGFGIVLINTNKLEVIDSYIIGNNGAYININAVTIDNQNIYATTNQGVLFANKNATNLADFNEWSVLSGLAPLTYKDIVTFNNNLITYYDDPDYNEDTIYVYNGVTWSKFDTTKVTVTSIDVSQNKLITSYEYYFDVYDASYNIVNHIWTYNQQLSPRSNQVVFGDEGFMWVADRYVGMAKVFNPYSVEVITPNGPLSSTAFKIDVVEEDVWVASGSYTPNFDNIYTRNGVHSRINSQWSSLDITNASVFDTIYDIVDIAIDPTDKSKIYASSWGKGIIEINNGKISAVYNNNNSSINAGIAKIKGIKVDYTGRLWALESFSTSPLHVKRTNGTWKSFSFPGAVTSGTIFTNLLIDDNGYKWLLKTKENEIIVFDDKGTLDNTNDDRFIVLKSGVGNGNLPGDKVYAITQDNDGEIWIGTNAGIAVIYSPSEIFNGSVDAEQILIQQDGITQILLETESVKSIAVDGANRKWICTENSGVFLMSDDGTEEIYHFTKDNSPLFSNDVKDAAINHVTGEVYFATDKGLISFKSTATEPKDDYSNVFVYPNPVKENFSGTIAIRGLVNDSDVRITDISGNVVFTTKSLGGQAIWDGKDFSGRKVQTGVYLVFLGNQDGSQKAAAKILIIN